MFLHFSVSMFSCFLLSLFSSLTVPLIPCFSISLFPFCSASCFPLPCYSRFLFSLFPCPSPPDSLFLYFTVSLLLYSLFPTSLLPSFPVFLVSLFPWTPGSSAALYFSHPSPHSEGYLSRYSECQWVNQMGGGEHL
jgi:hypothetical protein